MILKSKVAMQDKIPHRNRSPYGWWIASYLLRAAWDDESEPNPRSRCTAWENTIILQAPDREAAYAKALVLAAQDGSNFESEDGRRKGRWHFEGLTHLLPIYDELEDGAEVMWEEYEGRTVGKIRSWVKQKHELEAFDDTPTDGGDKD